MRRVSIFALALMIALFAAGAAAASPAAHPAAGTPAPASATLPALPDFSATTSPATPPGCGGASASPDALKLDPATNFLPRTPICGTCSDHACVGAAANATCGAGLKCFIITNCNLQPGTWQCTCSHIAP